MWMGEQKNYMWAKKKKKLFCEARINFNWFVGICHRNIFEEFHEFLLYLFIFAFVQYRLKLDFIEILWMKMENKMRQCPRGEIWCEFFWNINIF
jgi:hypothetical protein